MHHQKFLLTLKVGSGQLFAGVREKSSPGWCSVRRRNSSSNLNWKKVFLKQDHLHLVFNVHERNSHYNLVSGKRQEVVQLHPARRAQALSRHHLPLLCFHLLLLPEHLPCLLPDSPLHLPEELLRPYSRRPPCLLLRHQWQARIFLGPFVNLV